jgi:hypothetical protein
MHSTNNDGDVAYCNAGAEKSLLIAQERPETLEKRSRNARETPEERSRFLTALGPDALNQQMMVMWQIAMLVQKITAHRPKNARRNARRNARETLEKLSRKTVVILDTFNFEKFQIKGVFNC